VDGRIHNQIGVVIAYPEFEKGDDEGDAIDALYNRP
jgi:hypothetical protein